MANLYHISFVFKGVPKVRDLEPAFSDQEDDWVRLSPFTWLLWSPKPAMFVYNRIRPLIDDHDLFFLSKVELGASVGFLPPWVWDWINKKIPGSIRTGDEMKRLLPPGF